MKIIIIEIIKWASYGVGVLLVVGFGMYALFGFASYLFSDPFNWVKQEPIEYTNKYQIDIDNCRAKGMYPVTSGWNGSLKECKPF